MNDNNIQQDRFETRDSKCGRYEYTLHYSVAHKGWTVECWVKNPNQPDGTLDDCHWSLTFHDSVQYKLPLELQNTKGYGITADAATRARAEFNRFD